MTIHALTVAVRLLRPRISGTMLLHDDETHTVVPVVIEPTGLPPWFEAGPPRGDTIRDDFDDYRREAERIMHTLVAATAAESPKQDRQMVRIPGVLEAPSEERRGEREDEE